MTGETMRADDFDYIRRLVRDQSALTIEAGKEYLVESRLQPLAREEGFSSYLQLVQRLRTAPIGDLHRRAVEAMANNETSFFRDARAFGMMANSVVPALLAERSAARSLHIWCAACSTGQEPYSLAMLLREQGRALDGWDVRIIATDISRSALARARAGCYTQFEVNRGLPAHLLVKHFTQHGTTWKISEEIRGMVEFAETNLIAPWTERPAMQLILLRNVLIYLDVATRKTILQRVGRALDPRGYLILGGAETTTNLDDSFETAALDGAVCFRRRREGPAPSVPTPHITRAI